MKVGKNRGLRLVLLPLVVLFAALALAACGSSGGGTSSESTGEAETNQESTESTTSAEESGSGDFATVEEEVKERTERPTTIPDTTPFKGEFPTGKTIDYLQCAAPACVEIGEQLTEAAEAVSWNVKVIPEGATPEEVKAAWQLVTEEKPDGVVTTGGYPRQIFRQQLSQLTAEDIPVIAMGEPEPANPKESFIADVGGPGYAENFGKQAANWIIAETGGEANVLYVNSGFPINTLNEKGFVAQMEKECPDTCEVTTYQAPITSIGKDLASKIAAQLQAHPDVNYVVPAFGDMAVGLPAALASASIEPVPVITQAPGKANIADIESGAITAAWQPQNPVSAWSTVDTFGRYFTKQPYPDEIPSVEWWITGETMPKDEPFNAVEGYQQQYEELWNLK